MIDALQLIDQNISEKTPYLDLGNCDLDGSETEIFRWLSACKHLKYLNLSNSWNWFDLGSKEWRFSKSKNTGKRNLLRSLPEYLPQNLEILNVSGDLDQPWELIDLKSLAHVKKLMTLDVSNNMFTSLTDILAFNDLENLYIRNNHLSQIDGIEKLTKLKVLDASCNSINDIKPIEHNSNLVALDMAFNPLNSRYRGKSLIWFNFNRKSNEIQEIESKPPTSSMEPTPPRIKIELKGPVLREDPEMVIPPPLSGYKEVDKNIKEYSKKGNTCLIDSDDSIKAVIVKDNLINLVIQNCSNIHRINFSRRGHLKIYTIPGLYLKGLPAVNALFLNDLSIKKLEIENLDNLDEMDLSSFPLVGKDPSFLNGTGKQLVKIRLERNDLIDVSFLDQFRKLEIIDAAYNEISSTKEFEKFENLQALDLRYNQLKTVSLKGLKKLKSLVLSNNHIDTLEIDDLPSLRALHLGYNQIESISLDFLNRFPKLQYLTITDNPIDNLPPRLTTSTDNVLDDLKNHSLAIQQDEATPNDQIKLLVLGNSTSGKTSLIHYLNSNVFDPHTISTHGILNFVWQPFENMNEGSDYEKDIKISVWDFGGQEFYHSTHSLFFTDNSVYLVLFEAQTNHQGKKETDLYLFKSGRKRKVRAELEHFHYLYWLDNVHHFSENARILLVQNKCDVDGQIEVPDHCKSKYGLNSENNIFHISVKGAYEKRDTHELKFRIFKEQLFKTVKSGISQFQNSIKWQEIKNKIQSEWRKKGTITYDEYVRRCEKIKPMINERKEGEEKSQLETLTGMLHEQGVLLYFKDIESLRDKVFLDPEKVTESIYKVLDYDVIENQGKFDLVHVEKVSKGNTLFSSSEILELLLHFKLIFEVERHGREQYIAPQYLPSEFDEETQMAISVFEEIAKPTISFAVNYPIFFPKSVFLKFIAIYGKQHIKYWYNRNELIFAKYDKAVFARREISSETNTITFKIQDNHELLLKEIFDIIIGLTPNNLIEISNDGQTFEKLDEILDPKYRSLYETKFWFAFGSKKTDIEETMSIDSIFPESFLNEMKAQISAEYQNISDANLRRSIARDPKKRNEYETLIAQSEDNILFIRDRYLKDAKDSYEVSPDQFTMFFNEIREEIRNEIGKQPDSRDKGDGHGEESAKVKGKTAEKNIPTIVILTAINVEYQAVRKHLTNIIEHEANGTIYEAGEFMCEEELVAKVIIRETGPKNPTSAQETEKAISNFKPDMIFFVGIAGSRKPQDFTIGDVIFPDKVYYYEGGKATRDSFKARPDSLPPSHDFIERAKIERNKSDWKKLIKGDYEKLPKADIGIIASGEQLVEHYDSDIGKIIYEHYNDASVVEMENYGFLKAIDKQSRKNKPGISGIIRGISDVLEMNDNNESSHDRRPASAKLLAADSAAAFAFWVIFKLADD